MTCYTWQRFDVCLTHILKSHSALWVMFGVCVAQVNEVGTDEFSVKSDYCLLVLHM